MSDLVSKFNKERKSLEDYYKNFYDEDSKILRKELSKYNNSKECKAFIDGYIFSIKQPFTLTIKLIEMYVMDYVPRKKGCSSDEYIISQIREIFRGNKCNVVNENFDLARYSLS